ncbi:hypothetical protein FGE12_16385 [Aggregicoccus sp. 17bor-14]|uniref:hypothetical protein n=1 Tax=Myxococcaceae TaxID=31 RepID=UPI00129C6663|nr:MULTISPECIES: hypothetical protein [Myxococcaceae]MBF5043979.1 hypothetical protein [Simulacricoccus sp. 17bor-14]MRI89730.1 hypothetical protein [Aggregicoccus sp. 17bor-14]
MSLGTLVLLLLLGGAVYAASLYVPLWVDSLDVKEAVAAAHALSGQNTNDALLRNEIRNRTTHMGTHVESDGWGGTRTAPGLGLTDDQILIDRDPVTGSVRIEVSWDRPVTLKPTARVHLFHFRVVKEGLPPR